MLNDLGRRVLAHLPVWAEDEDALIEAEGGPESSVRSYDLPTFTERLAEDRGIRPVQSEDDVKLSLDALVEAGLASTEDVTKVIVERDGTVVMESEDTPLKRTMPEYRMTKEGFDALHAPREDAPTVPGQVFVNLFPSESAVAATSEGS